MPRQRSAPARASAAAARPRPAASGSSQPAASSGGGWFGSGAKTSSAAPPAPRPAAPAPAMPQQQSSGGGLMSGLMGSVATGMAMGTGSAVAHRAVDSMMGPREMTVVHENQPAAAPMPAAPMGGSPMGSTNPCEERVREFADCMTRSNGDMGACQFYFDSMNACKVQNRMA
mmetsp:Transcript_4781/g.10200  ORF Transcript_4781/g.10200 Transcript_4781/m.10200 type:complete len:172 (-) Transcript_4781:279-794(-)